MGAPFATLRDDFADNSVAAAWASATTGSATAVETGGQAVFTLPNNVVGVHDARFTSASSYDLTGDSWFANIGTMVATGVAASAFVQLYTADTRNRLVWIQASNTIKAQTMIAGVTTDRYSASWSASTYKYLRIRESGGSIFFDSSTNGTSWTNRFTMANPFTVTDLFIAIGASCGQIVSPGAFKLDDVNLILPALATNWRWTQVIWPLAYRYKVVTLALDTVGTAQGYVVTADGVDVNGDPSGNVRYWSGPANGGRLLTEQTTQAAAQAMAVNIPTDGRFDLPTIIEARVIRIYHRSIDGAAYTLREVYPRRLVQSDDIEAESIRAINIAASAITVDKLDAVLTITGKIIQTDYSGARVVLSGDAHGGLIGYGTTDTYDPVAGTGTYQILWSEADGQFYAGGGNVILDDNGLTIVAAASSPYDAQRSLDWIDNLAARIASVRGLYTGGTNQLIIEATNNSSRPGSISLQANATLVATLDLQGSVALGTASAKILAGLIELRSTNTSAVNGINFYGTAAASTPDMALSGGQLGINVPTVASDITAMVIDTGTNTRAIAGVLAHRTSGTPTTAFGVQLRLQGDSSTNTLRDIGTLEVQWATATDASRKGRVVLYAWDSASAREVIRGEASGSAPLIGFLGAAAVARPTVSGSRATDTWRQSVMTALASLGLVTDTSTA
jgi:hypothetical protein